MTVVRPDRARGTVLGRPLGDRQALRRIGYLPEAHRFPAYLTGMQLLHYYAALAKVPRSVRRRRADACLQLVGMADWADVKIGKYSRGMLQRLGIAQVLMNDPELIFLDEPTEGLDPMGRRDVRQMLLDLKARGKTMFINSHLLGELEMICDRVAILQAGQVVRQGSLKELTEHTVEYRMTVQGDLSAAGDEIVRAGGEVTDDTIVVAGHDSSKVNAMIDLLRSKGYLIEAVVPHRVSLEDIFVEAVGQQGMAGPAPPTAKPVAKTDRASQ